MALLWDRQFGFLKETLVAPVPRLTIMVGRTVGGATVALFQGLLVFGISLLAGFRPANALVVPTAILVMALIALVFSAMGTIIGSSLKEMQGFQIIMNFLVMPIFFLSGALYPLRNLPPTLTVLTRLDPLSYGVDALRGVLTGRMEFALTLNILALVFAASVLMVLGAWRFSKIEI
jgi:ABC-2 type transport system permease protein